MRWLTLLSLILGALAGYLYFFTERAVAPPPPPPPPPTEIAVGSLRLTLQDWRVSTTTEAARIDVTLEDPGLRRAEMVAFLERTLRDYREMVDPAAMPGDELAWIRESGRPYSLAVDGKAATASGDRSSYRLMVTYDTGGAHPNRATVAESYAEDGRALDLADVLGSGRTLERLADALRPRLLAAVGSYVSGYGGEPYEADEDFTAGTAPSPENYANWYLSGDDIVVIVNPYQVGPYTLGSYEVPVPLAEIAR